MVRASINSSYVVDAAVTLIRQDVANNRSLYSGRGWHDKTAGSGFWTASATPYSVSGPGINIDSSKTYDFRSTSRDVLWEGQFWVSHNSDGTGRTFEFSVSRTMANPPGGSATATQRVTPPTIPRATTPSFDGGSTLTAGSPVTIDLPRASSSFTHEVSYSFGRLTGLIHASAGGSVTWTPPLSLLTQIPSDLSGSGHVHVTTKSGSTEIGSKTIAYSLRVPASVRPEVTSVTITDDNPTVSSVVGQFVQGLSVLKATVQASTAYGSPIKSLRYTASGKAADSGAQIALTEAGTLPVIGTAIDERDRSGSLTKSITALPYSKPNPTRCIVSRSTASGEASDSGKNLRVVLKATVSSLMNETERNGMTIVIATRQKGATTPHVVRQTITAGLTYDATVVVGGGAIYDSDKSWDVLVAVTDKVGQTIAVQTIVATTEVYQHWAEGGIALGKFWERGALDVAGTIYQNNGRKVVDEVSMRELPFAPFGAAAGVVIATANGGPTADVTVTFPAGRFTQPPVVLGGDVMSSTNISFTAPCIGRTAEGATFRLQRHDKGNFSGTWAISWMALQMTPTSGEG